MAKPRQTVRDLPRRSGEMVKELAEADVTFSARARHDLRRLDPRTRTRIVAGIDRYAKTGDGDVKRVQAQRGWLRLRVGDWRVFVTRPNKGLVEIDSILHRGEPTLSMS